MIKISELYIYPVKSFAGISLPTSKLSKFGLEHDRRWMVVDEQGKFLSQRETAKMATVKTAIIDNQLILTHKDSKITVPAINHITNHAANQTNVTVWNDSLAASRVSTDVDKWLSTVLDKKCQLVYMPEQTQRQIDIDYAEKEQFVSFADGYPILLISQASLDDLNNRLIEPVNINRFRPNIVVTGTTAFAEDNWSDLCINEVKYTAVKKCSRCIIPSINQQTGKKDQAKMLAELNKFRKFDKKIKFGQNLIYKNAGLINDKSISCGDEIILNN